MTPAKETAPVRSGHAPVNGILALLLFVIALVGVSGLLSLP
jgi:hypothetical protein